MKSFGALYRYELKKLFQKKIVWISSILCVAIVGLSCSSDLWGNVVLDGKVVDSNYHYRMTDLAYQRALNGRIVDQALLAEMAEGYRKIPKSDDGRHYMATEEYQQYARPYAAIYKLVMQTTKLEEEIMKGWNPDEGEYDRLYDDFLESAWKNMYYLTEGEKGFWRDQAARIHKPFTFYEAEWYDRFFSMFQSIGLFVLLLQTICLAGMFSDEHSRRTDQLNLCTSKGRKSLYRAKIAVGVTFAVCSVLVMYGVGAAGLALIYGKGNSGAVFQLVYQFYAGVLNCGQAVWIAMGMALVTVALYAVGTMFLSEFLRNNIAVLGIGAAFLIAPLLTHIPNHFRVISQVWDWMPFSFLNVYLVFDARTLSLFGAHFTAWQAVPVIYAAAGALLSVFGRKVYGRYQVAGR